MLAFVALVKVAGGQPPPPPAQLPIGYVPKHLKIERRFEQRQASTVETSSAPVAGVSFNSTDGFFHGDGAYESPPAEIAGGYCEGGISAQRCNPPCLVPPNVLGFERLSFWGRAEYLGWWTKGMSAPPLATTSPANTNQSAAGVLGQPGTTVLFGNSRLGEEAQSGGRFSLGAWLAPCRTRGVEFTYTGVWDGSTSFSGSNDNFSILARPFVDAQTGAQDSLLIAFPGLVDGSLTINATTDFQTMDLSFRKLAANLGCSDVSWFFGYRFAELDDSINANNSTLSTSGPTDGTTIELFDRFDTESTFHGPQIGFQVSGSRGWWSLDLTTKLAVGVTSFEGRVAGQTVTTTASGDSTTVDAGLLAQGTNLGVTDDSEMTALSEVRVSLRRPLNCDWAATFGYTVIAWSDVWRASEQIDLSVNSSQIPPGTLQGTSRPAFPSNKNSFWAQGLHAGLEYRY